MREPAEPLPEPVDYGIAAIIGVLALSVYLRTLAPDLLFGDSGELQALAARPGLAHPSGSPVYVLLAAAVAKLPLGSLPWRVNALSAVAAALAISGTWLLCRHVTANRLAEGLATLALFLSTTLWSQAVIAEVYALHLALWVATTLLLWRARAGDSRGDALRLGGAGGRLPGDRASGRGEPRASGLHRRGLRRP